MNHKKIICIAGPTATGKTRLAIDLAKAFDGEIVSADAFQIYKGLDIGTAKPSMPERQGIPHHMLDIASPDDDYSVARYVEEASRHLTEIHRRGRLPILAGGSGLYMDSLVRGRRFAGLTPSGNTRGKLEALVSSAGSAALFELLKKHDPESAKRLHINDTKRIIRALEVFFETGETISKHNEHTKNLPPLFDAVFIGLNYADRALLYSAIDRRVDDMLAQGLVGELELLLASGVSRRAASMQAIGYKELFPYLDGEASLDAAAEDIKRESRRYAKRQLTWFGRNPSINWITIREPNNFDEVLRISTDYIRSNIL